MDKREPTKTGNEIDLVDIVGFLWRSKWHVVASIVVAVIVGFIYQIATARVSAYHSVLELQLKTNSQLTASSDVDALAKAVDTHINNVNVFKDAYDVMAKHLGDKLAPLSLDTAWSMQVYANNHYSRLRPIGFTPGNTDMQNASLHLTLNLPQQLGEKELVELAQALLAQITNGATEPPKEKKEGELDPFFLSIYEYVRIEQELRLKAQNLAEPFRSMFLTETGQAETKADRLYRRVAILEINGQLTPREARAVASRIYLVAQSSVPPGNSPPPYFQVDNVKVASANVKISRAPAKLAMVAFGYIGVGLILGWLIFGAREFYRKNSTRIASVMRG